MLFVIGVVVLIFFVLFVLPIKKGVLIEGKYDCECVGGTSPFQSNLWVFCFDEFCREHFEKWRRTGKEPKTMEGICTAGIPRHFVWNLSQIVPQRGDIVKIIGWKNIFGRIVAYQVEPSDFAYVDPYDEKYRLKALAAGFTDVEEYRRVSKQRYREKCIEEVIIEEGITSDEAEVLEYFPTKYGGIWFIHDTEAKRLGTTVVALEEEMKKRLREPICYEINGDYASNIYLEEKRLDPDIIDHLNKCLSCNISFSVALHGKTDQSFEEIDSTLNLKNCNEIDAEELGITVEELYQRREKNMTLRYGHGPNCYTLKERIVCATTDFLPGDRLFHKKECLGCERMLKADREDFLATGRIGGLAKKAWDESRLAKSQAV